jgi:cytochrome P450
MDREPINDYIFADGTKVPAGATLSVALQNANLNPDSYDDPLKFDGFRFIKMKERAILDGRPEKKFDMVTTNVGSLSFGHGRHVCPGRFFASTEIKLMLAYVVTTYDVKMREDGVRPPDALFVNRISPNPTAEVLFRRREVV